MFVIKLFQGYVTFTKYLLWQRCISTVNFLSSSRISEFSTDAVVDGDGVNSGILAASIIPRQVEFLPIPRDGSH